jgi:ATP-dependent DNA helicase RecG
MVKMNIEQLKSLIQQGESYNLEFKKSTTQLKSAFETVCAFLNGEGGTVLIGVTDKGQIVGQDVTDNTCQEIAREIHKIEPPAQCEIIYVPIADKKHVIVINILPGKHAPYVYDGRAFERNQTTVSRMTQHRYDQLVSRRFQHNFSWEKLAADGYSIQDLDKDLILGVVRKAVEGGRMPEDALRQEMPELVAALQLTMNGQLINAAVALFGKNVMPNYPQCQLKMARFKGLDRSEFLDSDIQYGNIFKLLESSMLFVKRHLPLAAKIEEGKLERVETPIIPFEAIREAIINSLSHRDYGDRSGSIGLAIYDDRMEIFSTGGLLPDVTLAKIKSGYSKPTNPLIADVLYRCNLIEKWGRGVPKMISSCKAANDPEPTFISDQLEFKVIFTFPMLSKPTVVYLDDLYAQHTNLTLRQKEIIQILSLANNLKPKDILARLNENTTDRTLRRDLAKLRGLNIVDTRGSGHSVIWFLTVKVAGSKI